MRRLLATAALLLALTAAAFQSSTITVGELPAEARETLRLIDAGGPYPYRRDGIVFQNRERRLPEQPRGYYREYTVPTPGSRDRGARRIVAGDKPPQVFYYTGDHYKTFRRVQR
ncbi:MAG: ribonuclease domain-containing protein [Sulfuritalea sp.]|nr:ribonuclease domain-containing protein [Sulfuritalea sp.]